jgi:exosortase
MLLAGLGVQLGGAYYSYEWFEAAALLPELAGLALLLGGRAALRWSGPSIAFLIFMVPLPYRLEGALSHPLQRVGTVASTYALQTLGLPAVAEGNVIHIDDISIGVVEACSGLGMLFTFIAMSAGVALVVRRPALDRAVILLSAAPIAVAVNVLRIATTGVLHRVASHELADRVFHDLAGWLMMPAALGLMAAELWLLSRLLVEPAPAAANPIGLPGLGGRPAGDRGGRPRRDANPASPRAANRSTQAS